jgi:hypothetical protein
MNNEINPGSRPADATNGHKPANAEFDLASELKTLEKTVNRLENVLCSGEYREAFVHRDCCKLLEHIVGQIENIIIELGGEDEEAA